MPFLTLPPAPPNSPTQTSDFHPPNTNTSMSNTPPDLASQPIFSIPVTPPPGMAGPTTPRTDAGSAERSAGAEKVKRRSTPLLQDRQARGKEPRTGRAVGEGEEEGEGEKRVQISYQDDSYEAVERRRWAATILDSPEMLAMHAQSRQDTIPSTRLYFTKILCGYDDPPKRREKKAYKSRRSGGREVRMEE